MSSFSARERWLLIAMMAPSGFALIASGMLSVALPAIQREYRVPVELLAWVVAAPFVPRVPLEPIYGRLADMLGKRRLYLIGLTIFTLGCALMIPAPTFTWLVAAAALQGIGMASFSIGMAVIVEEFPKERRGRALGFWNAANPFGLMAGPIIGGIITEWLGWRSNFLLITVACLASLYVGMRFIPSGLKSRNATPFDSLGAVALMVGVGSTLLAATTGSLIPFGSTLDLILWIIAGCAFAVLIWNARSKPDPFIGSDIFRNRHFIGPTLAVNLRMFAHDGARFILVLYLANVLHQSPSMVGWVMFLYGLPLFIGVIFGGYLADRWATRVSGNMGTIGQAAGLLWMSMVSTSTDIIAFAPGMIAAGFFGGACLVPFSKEAVAALGIERAGLASGLYNMLRFAGSAAATPLLGLLLARGFENLGGSNTAPEPYQLAFQVLAVVAGLGAIAVMLIPAPARGELAAEAVHD